MVIIVNQVIENKNHQIEIKYYKIENITKNHHSLTMIQINYNNKIEKYKNIRKSIKQMSKIWVVY